MVGEFTFDAVVVAALITVSFLLSAVLVGIVYQRYFKGTAFFKSKGVRLTGVFAVPVIVFVLLWQMFSSTTANMRESRRDDIAAQRFEQPVLSSGNDQRSDVIARVRLSPATQLLPKAALLELDRNDFIIHEELAVAVGRPVNPTQWEIGVFPSIATIGMLDIPGVAASLRVLPGSSSSDITPTTFGVKARQTYDVIIDDETTIQDLPILFNPLRDPLVAEGLMAYFLDSVQEYSRYMRENFDEDKVQTAAREYMDREMERADEQYRREIPHQKKVQNGVFVTIFRPSDLNNYLMNRLLPRRTLLEATLQYVVISGLFGIGGITDVYVASERGIAAFNGSVSFKDMLIDGERRRGTMNNIGFVVVAQERVVLTNIVYLQIGQPVAEFGQIEDIFDSLRIGRELQLEDQRLSWCSGCTERVIA